MTPSLQIETEVQDVFTQFPALVKTQPTNRRATNQGPASLSVLAHPPSTSRKTIRVALAGCGVVGGGLLRLLHESSSAISGRYGLDFTLARVLVRDIHKDRNLPIERGVYTNDLESFLATDADVFVEAIGGREPAHTIASSAIGRGKKVITANKELIAAHGHRLASLATATGGNLDFGAAVGGSAPVISTLRDLTGGLIPRSVRGILNGTSNYVLSLVERGASLDSALARARELGLAESDCSRDLDGRDAAAKLAIIAWTAFGLDPAELLLRRTPLVPGLERLVRCSKTLNARVRYIAQWALLPDRRIAATVEPTIVAEHSSFARTVGEENRVEVDMGWSSPLTVSGPGAGGQPTASALLSDLVRLSPVPNGRSTGESAFTSVDDSQSHQWLIVANVPASTLLKSARAFGCVPIHDARVGQDSFIVTAHARWSCVSPLLHSLEAANANPAVARYEIQSCSENNS
jgi:homoserine dehydrogenase